MDPAQRIAVGRNSFQTEQESAKLAIDPIIQEHDAMDSIADNTGGHAIYNTTNLKQAMTGIIANGDRYYTVAFDPTGVKKDGKFHKVTVQFRQPGYTLLYRHGYVAEDGTPPATNPGTANKNQTSSEFRTGMDSGGPPVSEILFRVQVAAEPQQPSAADQLKGDNANLKRPIKRYVFGYTVGIDAAGMTATPDGVRHGLLLAMVIAYDNEGRPLNSVLNTEKLDLNPKVYADALRQGLPFYQELDIPPGYTTVRVGVYDMGTTKMGATEFPLTVAPPK